MSRWTGAITTGFAGVAHSFSHLFVLLYATIVLVLEREWSLSYAELLALSVPGTVMFGLAALPAGWLGDRWTATGMISIFFLGVGAAAILTACAIGPVTVALGLTLMGTFAAIYHPVGIPWLVVRAKNRGRALGINGVFGSAGTAAAALVAGLLSDLLGWRAAFLIPGLIAIAVGISFIIACRAGIIETESAPKLPEPEPNRADVRKAFIWLSVTMLCTGLIFQSTSFALPKLFDERLRNSLGDGVTGVGGMVTLCYLVSALAQIIGGELADRFSLKTVYFWVQILQIPVVALAFVIFNPALVPLAALMISLNVAGQPAENSMLARYTPAKWRGRAFGAKFVLTLGVSALGVAMIPVLHALFGSLDVMLVALGLFAAIAALAATRLPGAKTSQPTALPAIAAE